MKRILFACICTLLFVSYSFAEDKPYSGEVYLGGRAININHPSANFNRYNAIAPGAFGGGSAAYDSDSYHVWVDGAYLGDDDFHVKMKGGKWGAFKFSLYFTEFPHNYSFEARDLFNNPGSTNLTFNGPTASAGVTDLTRWGSSSFDYKVRRRDVGGSLDLTAVKPFFFNVEANQLQKKGDIPWTGTSGQASFKSVEMPLPIDNTTRNVTALAGWKSKEFYVALGGGFSKFNNDDEFTRFRDPFTTGTPGAGATSFGTAVSAPDNRSWNLNFTGTAKLPLASVFALNAGYQRNTSTANILNSIDSSVTTGPVGNTITNPITQALTLNRSTFNGDIEYWSFGATLTSKPVKNLDTKLYFKYLDDRNKSDGVTFSTPGNDPVATEVFDYQKTTMGVEASYRFLKELKGIVGYEFVDTRRKAQEFEAGETSTESGTPGFTGNDAQIPDTWDSRFTGQLVANPLDWLGARLKYQYLLRNAHFIRTPGDPLNVDDAVNVLANNFRRFDICNKEQNMVKFSTDVTPIRSLDLTLEYAYKKDNYFKSPLGYQEAKSNEFIVDASYDWKGIKFFGFFDYDDGYTKQSSRYTNVTTPTLPSTSPNFPNPDPTAAPNINSFNWDVKLDNKNYAYGIGTAIPIMKNKLSFVVQYDFEKNNGNADFTSQTFTSSQAALGINNSNIGITPWDDYTRQNISARLNYDMRKDIRLVFGYLYSQFKLNDGQLNGYQLVPAGQNVLLSGAYTDQSFNANIYYIKLYYMF